jgi:hypothetical protein
MADEPLTTFTVPLRYAALDTTLTSFISTFFSARGLCRTDVNSASYCGVSAAGISTVASLLIIRQPKTNGKIDNAAAESQLSGDFHNFLFITTQRLRITLVNHIGCQNCSPYYHRQNAVKFFDRYWLEPRLVVRSSSKTAGVPDDQAIVKQGDRLTRRRHKIDMIVLSNLKICAAHARAAIADSLPFSDSRGAMQVSPT